MAVLKRQDNFFFVLQPYRETLAIKNSSLLRKEIRYLSEQHGEHVKLFKRKGAEYEAVFSKDNGYLLAEMIWHHLHQPEEMIYCEVLPQQYDAIETEDVQILLVVVREGKIYLDTKLNLPALQQELSDLLIETKGRYDVYLYGDFPEHIFINSAIKSLYQLDNGLFDSIHIDPQFQLLPIENALDEHGLGLKRHTSLVVVTVISICVLAVLWWWSSHSQKKQIIQVNPYQAYEQALHTPNPEHQIDALMKNIEKIHHLQGWYASTINYDGQIAKMALHSLGGTAAELMMESEAIGMHVEFLPQGALLSFITTLESREIPDHISNTQKVIAVIIDRMMRILPGKSVQIYSTNSNSVFSQTGVTINYKNISAPILELIGKNLSDLPVVLTSFRANISNGLLSGNLQLNVVGNER